MGIEAILPPLKHLLLQFQISQVLSSFSDELLIELLFLLHDLLLNGLLVTSPLIGLIIDMMLLTLQISHITLVHVLIGLEFRLRFNNLLLLFSEIRGCDVLQSYLASHHVAPVGV